MKTIKKIILLLLLTICVSACEDTGIVSNWLQNPVFEKPMTVVASTDSIILKEGHEKDTAVIFTWNKGNDRGAGTKLTYLFRMDIAGKSFETATNVEEMEPGIFSKSITVGELNTLLLEHWGIPGGSTVKIDAEIIARVDSSKQYQKPELASVSFYAKGFSLGPLPLYLVGSAISGGWDYSKGVKLTEIIERKQYSYTGNFSVGTFKVIESISNEFPSLNPLSDSLLYYRTSAENKDSLFSISKSGRYTFYMDRSTLKYALAYTPYEKIYMVGAATTAGRDINAPVQLNWDVKNPEVFTFTGSLLAGEMKFPLSTGNWGCDFLMPIANGTIINGDATDITTMQFVAGGNPDKKWIIKSAGTYKITVNPAKLTVVFKKL